MRKKTKEALKNQITQERRVNFVSSITETPPQISWFSNILYEVLDTESNDIEWLKQAAKKAESFVSWWISICDDIGFYSFQTYLVDVLGSRQPLITYIRNMSTTATKKNMKELKQFAHHYNHTPSISDAINVCYHLQEKIKKDLSNPATKPNTKFHQQEKKYNERILSETSTISKDKAKTNTGKKQSLADELFWWSENNSFSETMLSEEDFERSRDKTVDIINNKYYFTSEGIPVLKSSYETLQEKLKRDDGFIQ